MVHGEMRAARPGAGAQHAFKIGGSQQAANHGFDAAWPLIREPGWRESQQAVPASDGQALAALGAASVDHCTTPARLHANQKAMRACAANFGGLVGAFHDLSNSV